MKPKIISILLLLIIAFSIVTLSGCWLLNNDSNSDGDSSLDTDGSSSSKPAREFLLYPIFEDKIYTADEEIVIEVKLGTLNSRKRMANFYQEIDMPIDKNICPSNLYLVLFDSLGKLGAISYYEKLNKSELTVIHVVEDFCAENYPLGNGYNYDIEKLNSVQVKIPKTVFSEDVGTIGIRAFSCGTGAGITIYYKIQENGIFISEKYIEGALDNEDIKEELDNEE